MRVRGICFGDAGWFFWSMRERRLFVWRGAVSLFFGGRGASRFAWLNCRRFRAEAILLERRCALLGVRFSSAMRFHGVAFEACVFH